jgi:hypothetical protein
MAKIIYQIHEKKRALPFQQSSSEMKEKKELRTRFKED